MTFKQNATGEEMRPEGEDESVKTIVKDHTCSYMGQNAEYLTQEGFKIEVVVKAEKSHFGRVDLEVTPLHGTGTKWVTSSRLDFTQRKAGNREMTPPNEALEKHSETA